MISFHYLLACTGSDEKSVVSLINVPCKKGFFVVVSRMLLRSSLSFFQLFDYDMLRCGFLWVCFAYDTLRPLDLWIGIF